MPERTTRKHLVSILKRFNNAAPSEPGKEYFLDSINPGGRRLYGLEYGRSDRRGGVTTPLYGRRFLANDMHTILWAMCVAFDMADEAFRKREGQIQKAYYSNLDYLILINKLTYSDSVGASYKVKNISRQMVRNCREAGLID